MVVAESRAPRRIAASSAAPLPATMAHVHTAWGICGIVWENRINECWSTGFFQGPPYALLTRIYTPGLGIAALRQSILKSFPACREVLCNAHGEFHPDVVPEWFGQIVRFLQTYYSTALRDLTAPRFADHWAYWRIRLDWSRLTVFQQQVLQAVATIPPGVQLTYAQVARQIGRPSACRAVGAAVGSNPWPVLIPCHRVVGSGGRLVGFSAPGGVHAKRRMLEMETHRPGALGGNL